MATRVCCLNLTHFLGFILSSKNFHLRRYLHLGNILSQLFYSQFFSGSSASILDRSSDRAVIPRTAASARKSFDVSVVLGFSCNALCCSLRLASSHSKIQANEISFHRIGGAVEVTSADVDIPAEYQTCCDELTMTTRAQWEDHCR